MSTRRRPQSRGLDRSVIGEKQPFGSFTEARRYREIDRVADDRPLDIKSSRWTALAAMRRVSSLNDCGGVLVLSLEPTRWQMAGGGAERLNPAMGLTI
jgi:hypothetical protein